MAVEAVSGNGGEAVAVAPAPAPVKEVSAKVEAKEAAAVTKNASFREESNFLDDLKESERKALAELRDKVEAAILEGKLFDDRKPEVKEKGEAKKKAEKAPEEKKEEVNYPYRDSSRTHWHWHFYFQFCVKSFSLACTVFVL